MAVYYVFYTQVQQFFSNLWIWFDNQLKFALLKNKCERDYSFHFIMLDESGGHFVYPW